MAYQQTDTELTTKIKSTLQWYRPYLYRPLLPCNPLSLTHQVTHKLSHRVLSSLNLQGLRPIPSGSKAYRFQQQYRTRTTSMETSAPPCMHACSVAHEMPRVSQASQTAWVRTKSYLIGRSTFKCGGVICLIVRDSSSSEAWRISRLGILGWF
jgi:hypothetical protein